MEITKRDLKFFKLARKASQYSTYNQQHLGCVAVYKGKVLSYGWNAAKTSPIQRKYNRYRNLEGNNVKHKIHAEIMALNKIKHLDIDFSDVKLYVWRELKDGTKALAKPCKACDAMIKAMGIKTVNYTIYNGYACEKIA